MRKKIIFLLLLFVQNAIILGQEIYNTSYPISINPNFFRIEFHVSNEEIETLNLSDFGVTIGRIIDYHQKDKSEKYQSLVLLNVFLIENDNNLVNINAEELFEYPLKPNQVVKLKLVAACMSQKINAPSRGSSLTEKDISLTNYTRDILDVNRFKRDHRSSLNKFIQGLNGRLEVKSNSKFRIFDLGTDFELGS